MNHILFQKWLEPQIYYASFFLAKYVLTDVVNNVVKETDAEHSQKELDQLSMPRQVK